MTWLTDFIQKHKTNTGWRKWLFGGLVLLAIVAAVAVYFVRAHFAGREIAKLKHETDIAREQLKYSRASIQLTKNEEELRARLAEVKRSREVVEALEEQLASVEAGHAAEQALISSITSWEDVDAKVK